MSSIKSPEGFGIMYQVCSRRRDAPDSAAGLQADFPFEGEAGVRPDGVVASQEPCSGKFRRGGRGDLRLTVVPPVDMGTRRMARPARAERTVNTNMETTCSGTSGNS